MKVVTIEDAKVLIPNAEHKNFTATDIIIPKGTELIGDVKLVNGLRKGETFQYRLFYTTNNEIIYTNKIKPINMETTEVKLGADGANAKAKIIDIPAQLKDRNALIGLALGATAGFGYATYKKEDYKKKLMYTLIGAGLGFVAGKTVTKNKKVTIK
jgi:hypothetical protein